MNNKYPNIFDYATKELSQDAFFTWLINWASPEYNGNPLHDCAVEFINELLPENINVTIESIETFNQWEHTDIWVSINEKIAIVIEDKINAAEHNNQLEDYEYTAREWCKDHNYECYFVFLKTGVVKQQEREYLEQEHEKWKIVDCNTVLNLFNKYREKTDNNIFLDYVNKRNSIENASNSFLNNPIEKWDYAAVEGFFYELDNKIDEWHGWGYVNNPSGGFLGLWWHFIKCKDKPFEYYLQLQGLELFIRINATMLEESDRKSARDEAIRILDNNLSIAEKHYIDKPKRLACGKYMAIKHIDQNAWLIKNSDGIVDIDKTVAKLKEFTYILDRCM